MKKHRISTTISAKHWGLLKKHTDKFETQQKALEFALENLEKNLEQRSALSPEEQLWMRTGKDLKPISLLHRDYLEALFQTADVEQLEKITKALKPAEHLVVWYYQKPLKNCTLKEVIDGIILIIKVANLCDTVNCTDEGDCYILKVTHSLTIRGSKMFKIYFEDVFRAYGAKMECEITRTAIFMKIFKSAARRTMSESARC